MLTGDRLAVEKILFLTQKQIYHAKKGKTGKLQSAALHRLVTRNSLRHKH
jgi:hypothetical protein